MKLEEEILYKTNELISINNSEIPCSKNLKGIEISINGYKYLFFNEYIRTLSYDYLLNIFQKYKLDMYIRVAKRYINAEEWLPFYATRGCIRPITWKYDRDFRKENNKFGTYDTSFCNDKVEFEDYDIHYRCDKIFYPSDKNKIDIKVTKNQDGEIELLIEEIFKTKNKEIGRCIHATISGDMTVCSHVDFSINKYGNNRFVVGLDKKIESQKRIHLFRIDNVFEVEGLPNLLINIFEVKSTVMEVISELDMFLNKK